MKPRQRAWFLYRATYEREGKVARVTFMAKDHQGAERFMERHLKAFKHLRPAPRLLEIVPLRAAAIQFKLWLSPNEKGDRDER